jgi:hypothetical protein
MATPFSAPRDPTGDYIDAVTRGRYQWLLHRGLNTRLNTYIRGFYAFAH